MYYITNNICMMKPRPDLFPYLALKNWIEDSDDWIYVRMNNSRNCKILFENIRLHLARKISSAMICNSCRRCIIFSRKLFFRRKLLLLRLAAEIFHTSKSYFCVISDEIKNLNKDWEMNKALTSSFNVGIKFITSKSHKVCSCLFII